MRTTLVLLGFALAACGDGRGTAPVASPHATENAWQDTPRITPLAERVRAPHRRR
ncbi:MAG: hypothetical protein GY946_30560 [bacterium]|nr:hypothetical protein [bacterium]